MLCGNGAWAKPSLLRRRELGWSEVAQLEREDVLLLLLIKVYRVVGGVVLVHYTRWLATVMAYGIV